MDRKHVHKDSEKPNRRLIEFGNDSIVKWTNLGKNLNDFWEDLFNDIVE